MERVFHKKPTDAKRIAVYWLSEQKPHDPWTQRELETHLRTFKLDGSKRDAMLPIASVRSIVQELSREGFITRKIKLTEDALEKANKKTKRTRPFSAETTYFTINEDQKEKLKAIIAEWDTRIPNKPRRVQLPPKRIAKPAPLLRALEK